MMSSPDSDTNGSNNSEQDELKKYDRNRLSDLSTKSVGEISQLDEPTYEQKKWVLGRLRQSSKHWRRWCE